MITREWLEERCTEDADCLRWNLARDNCGHPRYTFRFPDGTRCTKGVRKMAYEALVRPVPRGKYVTMTCGCPWCLNVEHMEVVGRGTVTAKTWKDPATRVKKVMAVAKTSRLARGKLDMEKARYIRHSDKTGAELARELGVSHTVVSRVRNGTGWRESGNPFAGLMG